MGVERVLRGVHVNRCVRLLNFCFGGLKAAFFRGKGADNLGRRSVLKAEAKRTDTESRQQSLEIVVGVKSVKKVLSILKRRAFRFFR